MSSFSKVGLSVCKGLCLGTTLLADNSFAKAALCAAFRITSFAWAISCAVRVKSHRCQPLHLLLWFEGLWALAIWMRNATPFTKEVKVVKSWKQSEVSSGSSRQAVQVCTCGGTSESFSGSVSSNSSLVCKHHLLSVKTLTAVNSRSSSS